MIAYHLYTTSAAARGRAVSVGYNPGGVAFHTPVPAPSDLGAIALYRYRVGNDHIYTTDPHDISAGTLGSSPNDIFETIACHLYGSPAQGRSPLYELYRWSPSDHFYTRLGSVCKSVHNGGSYTFRRTHGFVSDTAEAQLYRAYNSSTGDHFYTTSYDEISLATASGYSIEGPPANNAAEAMYVPSTPNDVVPVYQLKDLRTGRFVYTTSRDEVTRLIKYSSSMVLFEGAAFFLFSRADDGAGGLGRTPVYLLSNPSLEMQIFTTSREERDHAMGELGFLDAGIAGYAAKEASATTRPLFVCEREARSQVVSASFQPARGERASNWLLSAERQYPAEARFSKAPSDVLRGARESGYNEVLIAEGVPLLDRDINALGDLAAARLYEAFERRFGNGAVTTDAHGDRGFAIKAVSEDPVSPANEDDFVISAGSFLVGGILITCPADVRYSAQEAGQAPLARPREAQWGDPRNRVDVAYLDVWIEEESGSNNASDLGAQTTTLSVPRWAVRVAEGGALPPEPRGHRYCPLAAILRPTRGELRGLVSNEQIEDLRVRIRSLREIEDRVAAIRSAAQLSFVDVNNKYIPIQPVTVTRGNEIVVTGYRMHVGKAIATIDGREVPAKHVSEGWFGAGLRIIIPPPIEPGTRYLYITNGFGGNGWLLTLNVATPFVSTTTVPSLKRYPQGDSLTLYGENLDLARAIRFSASGSSYVTSDLAVSTNKIKVYYKPMPVGSYTAYVVTAQGAEIQVPMTIWVE